MFSRLHQANYKAFIPNDVSRSQRVDVTWARDRIESGSHASHDPMICLRQVIMTTVNTRGVRRAFGPYFTSVLDIMHTASELPSKHNRVRTRSNPRVVERSPRRKALTWPVIERRSCVHRDVGSCNTSWQVRNSWSSQSYQHPCEWVIYYTRITIRALRKHCSGH